MGIGRGACTDSFEITPYLLFPFSFVFNDKSVVISLPIAPSCSLDCPKAAGRTERSQSNHFMELKLEWD